MLEEDAWETMKPKLEEYMLDYKAWSDSNPLMRYPESAQSVSSKFRQSASALLLYADV